MFGGQEKVCVWGGVGGGGDPRDRGYSFPTGSVEVHRTNIARGDVKIPYL